MKKIRLAISPRPDDGRDRAFCWRIKDGFLWREHRDYDLPAIYEYGSFYWYRMGQMINVGGDRNMNQSPFGNKEIVFYFTKEGAE